VVLPHSSSPVISVGVPAEGTCCQLHGMSLVAWICANRSHAEAAAGQPTTSPASASSRTELWLRMNHFSTQPVAMRTSDPTAEFLRIIAPECGCGSRQQPVPQAGLATPRLWEQAPRIQGEWNVGGVHKHLLCSTDQSARCSRCRSRLPRKRMLNGWVRWGRDAIRPLTHTTLLLLLPALSSSRFRRLPNWPCQRT
jgi:hypothetical protein